MTARFVTQQTPDPILVQVLEGQNAWSKLSKPQRALLEGHLTLVDASAKLTSKRFAVSTSPVKAAPRTLESLRSKGVIDSDDRLTWTGVYALLWGPPKDERRAVPAEGGESP